MEVGKTTAYLRRNIEQTIDGEGNDAWSYEECQMSLAEYEKYKEDMSSPAIENVMQTLSSIEAEQTMQGVISDSNTETIMQALSDLQADVAMIGL